MKRYMKLKTNMLVEDALELLGTISRPNSSIEITHDNGELHVYEIGQPDPPEYDPQCVEVTLSKQIDGRWVHMVPDSRPGWVGVGLPLSELAINAAIEKDALDIVCDYERRRK
jgi:hypothetical protein